MESLTARAARHRANRPSSTQAQLQSSATNGRALLSGNVRRSVESGELEIQEVGVMRHVMALLAIVALMFGLYGSAALAPGPAHKRSTRVERAVKYGQFEGRSI